MTLLSSSPPRRAGPIIHPFAVIVFVSLLNVAAEVFLKRGSATGSDALLGFGALASLWTWIGIACKVAALLSWLWVLRSVPLGIAFSLMNAVFVLVPLAANLFLHEPIHAQRWFGIALVVVGALVIVRPLVIAEDKL